MSTQAIATLVIGALSAFFVAARQLIKWALGHWEESQKLTREAHSKGTDALIANTASNAVLIVKVDYLTTKIDGIAGFVQDAKNEITEHNNTATRRRDEKFIPGPDLTDIQRRRK